MFNSYINEKLHFSAIFLAPPNFQTMRQGRDMQKKGGGEERVPAETVGRGGGLLARGYSASLHTSEVHLLKRVVTLGTLDFIGMHEF